MSDEEYEGRCHGETVFLPSEDHPTILGQDGEPLRYSRRNPIGFDLTPRRKAQRKKQEVK